MKKSDKAEKTWSLSVAGGALGAVAAMMLALPSAHADPDIPPSPEPGGQSITTQAAAGNPVAAVDPAPPTEVPHLSSPDNLPPGTTNVPLDQQEGRRTSYLRDLWHAVQSQELSGKDAMILLFTQQPMDANAMPTNGLPAAPQAPPGSPPPLGAPAPDAPRPAGAPPGPASATIAPPPAPEAPTR